MWRQVLKWEMLLNGLQLRFYISLTKRQHQWAQNDLCGNLIEFLQIDGYMHQLQSKFLHIPIQSRLRVQQQIEQIWLCSILAQKEYTANRSNIKLVNHKRKAQKKFKLPVSKVKIWETKKGRKSFLNFYALDTLFSLCKFEKRWGIIRFLPQWGHHAGKWYAAHRHHYMVLP